ncbi:MAG: cytochrome C oxidase subunit IV family protein [Oligoflexia bacterium]|nr:cytochrome C oxidase subunit IV family protein [Oligoflexia bacterium]
MSTEAHGHSHAKHYVKIWAILLVLFLISITGPMIGIRVITLITAFGIAVVKALMVASEFMHLKFEKKFVTYMLLTMLFLMFLFFFAVAPDVMKTSGQNWVKIPMQEQPAATKGH